MLTKEQRAKWSARLRDPESKQTEGCLKDDNGMCCLMHGAIALDFEGALEFKEYPLNDSLY